MKKSTKGALAAAAAGSLLLGGAGSLAYWTDAQDITGTSITSGHLKLNPDSTSCDASWMLGATAYTTQVLVPGDTLTRHCKYTVSKSGANLAARLNVSAPGFAAGSDATLMSDMTFGAAFSYDADGGGAVSSPAAVTGGVVNNIANGATVDATLSVTFKNVNAKNDTSNTGTDLMATIDKAAVTITQTAPVTG
jgi:alternate signal-mediated exported protein